ncbi:uncharacterized protein DUF2846 [Pedobacter psychrotolerans]|uniref:Uncharacterized protein DUF2846 n=1 Tax=Pedobacter psychrotolerans TaxID=1843235 RepID=A0A4V2RYI3_9SPHI|nr:DUF2846 domain-containing protein [Pedobacter psychrotolerans]TCO19877.1 uncharacterized protein DUF2846 [Pedobacter psychrotolerans]GGE49560.1 hypothetical protein GCM10011413_14630 [Pedobacter psychrotolerans]
MKTFKFSLLAFLLATTFGAFSQTNTGKVYLIRSTGYTGSAVNYSIFVDGKLICKLKNKSFSIHNLNVGEHKVTVVSGGLSNGKKSAPLTFMVAENKTNYITVASTQNGYANKITCQEITENSATPILAKAKEHTNCLTEE